MPAERLWLPLGAVARIPRSPRWSQQRGSLERAVLEEQGAGSAAQAFGDLRVEPLWPPRDGPGRFAQRSVARPPRSTSRVARCCSRAISRRARRSQLVASGAPLHADLLKLSHHGSRTSSSRAFLDAVGGAVAVASAPRWSRFAMPHPEVVARAEEQGYAVWWTGRDGAVLVGLEPLLYVRGWR